MLTSLKWVERLPDDVVGPMKPWVAQDPFDKLDWQIYWIIYRLTMDQVSGQVWIQVEDQVGNQINGPIFRAAEWQVREELDAN